jgi:hypothetical protein
MTDWPLLLAANAAAQILFAILYPMWREPAS